MIILYGFQIESPNLRQICILGFSLLVLKMGVIYPDLQGHLAISTQNSRKRRSTSLLFTDLDQPGGVSGPKRPLVTRCSGLFSMEILDFSSTDFLIFFRVSPDNA